MAQIQHGGTGHIAPPYTPGYEVVTFVWGNEHGHCYDCGLPAHFYLPVEYGEKEAPNDTNKRCGVCAANAAAEGATVKRIPETATCKHCGKTIWNDLDEGWVDFGAGYDDENGDGVWRTSCPEHDTFTAEHEPGG